MNSYIGLLFFISFSSCQWSEPQKVIEAYSNSTPSIYADALTNLTYLIYPFVYNRELAYVCRNTILPNDTWLNHECFRQDLVIEDLAATGKDGNGTLYLAYSAKRNAKETKCDEYYTYGCTDIYFIESIDGGSHWSKPVRVPRINMSDSVMRTKPKILYAKNSGRLFISYDQYYAKDDQYMIATATRANGSIIFANELVMDAYWSRPILEKAMAYTLNGKTLTLSIILKVEDYAFQRRYSTDFGRTWKVDTYNVGDNAKYSISMSRKKDAIYMISVSERYGYALTYITNKDTKTYKYLQGLVQDENVIIGEDLKTNNHSAIFTAKLGNMAVMTTGQYNIDSQELKDLHFKPPFYPFMETASILINEKEAKMRVAHLINGDLYLSTLKYQLGKEME